MKTIARLTIAAIATVAMGCSTAGGAFGKLQKADDAIAAKYGGTYGTAALGAARKVMGVPNANDTRDRVPDGYALAWDSWLDGKLIDTTKIITVPKLVPLPGSPVVVPTVPTPPADPTAAPADPPPAGQADDVPPPAPTTNSVPALLQAIGNAGK